MKTITQDNQCEILWRAVETGNLVVVSELLRSGVDVDAANSYGTTALMRAAASGRMSIVSLLLEYGANPNGTRNDGFTPLLLAAFFGHVDVVRTLTTHGANSKATTRFGTSAQMWASARTFHEVVDYLQGKAQAPRVVETVSAETPVDELDASSVVVDSAEELCIVQGSAFERRHAAVACVLSTALLLGGAMITRVKLWPAGSTPVTTVSSVAAAERVPSTEQSQATAIVESPGSEKKSDNNHHAPQISTKPNERKTAVTRIPEITLVPTIQPNEAPTQEIDIEAAPTVAPLEVKKTANVTTPNNNVTSYVPTRVPLNNSQLISPKSSTKSGKVIPWP